MRGQRLRRSAWRRRWPSLVVSASWLAGLRASAEVCELRGSYREDDNLLLMPTCVAIAALLLFICAHRLGALDLATNATSAKQAGLERGPTCAGTVLNSETNVRV